MSRTVPLILVIIDISYPNGGILKRVELTTFECDWPFDSIVRKLEERFSNVIHIPNANRTLALPELLENSLYETSGFQELFIKFTAEEN